MFNDIGKKLKTIAKVFWGIDISLYAIANKQSHIHTDSFGTF